MPLGPRITNEVKRFIAEVHDKNPDWRAKEVKEEVQVLLRRVNHQVKPDWPGLSVIQVELKKLRDRKVSGEPFGIDRPWSIGRLVKYDIPSEVIPRVLEIQEIRGNNKPLTIRDAKWIGRLHAVFQNIMGLAVWSTVYAEREKICEQSGIEKDTSDIDTSIRSKYVTLPFYFQWLFQQDWIPDSYKNQVAKEQAQQYENALEIKAEEPSLTTNGWLFYADGLQQLLLPNNTTTSLPKQLRQLVVLICRLSARQEGKILSSPGKYIDMLDLWKTHEFHESLVESTDEPLLFSGSPSKRFAEELQKFNDPDLVELVRRNSGGISLEAINKISGNTDNMKGKYDDIEGGSQ